MKEITVKIGKDGKVQIETAGFIGAECKDATAAMKALLGLEVEQEDKPEYFQVEEEACKLSK